MSATSISVSDLFTIGIGPSSSHTVGPMRAAQAFVDTLSEAPAHVTVTFRGSLAATGVGHGTDRATLLGLVGYTPTTVSPDIAPVLGTPIPASGTISGPARTVAYSLKFDPQPVAEHPNCLYFDARAADGRVLAERVEYFSVGGGFIQDRAEIDAQRLQGPLPAGAATVAREVKVPHPFECSDDLLLRCDEAQSSIADVQAENERFLHHADGWDTVVAHLDRVWETMQECVSAGIDKKGTLPGGLGVKRRAPRLHQQLLDKDADERPGGLDAMEWVNLYALSVNEENAAGGRVVTAPTNGAAGIIPAVMHYCRDFTDGFSAERAREFLLTAGAVGAIIKTNASISGAEVGCQGEVGSASAMAAAGLCAYLGGSPAQVENAAEIALEHNLGLTCDPVGGLVQIPCIERNAIGAIKSINAARLARLGDGNNRVSLDNAIETMAATGRDMLTKYKETSTGGLATQLGFPVNITEC
ncbi:L-serine ammonia-lyase [Corynebacterium sp. S7]